MSPRCIVCSDRAVHHHHVVYRQHVLRHGGDLQDERNLVPMCFGCHGSHHGRARVLRLAELPDSVFDFATELMGAGAAFEYMRRYYSGFDRRHDVLADAA